MNLNDVPRIEHQLQQDLPGWSAQKIMSPVSTSRYLEPGAQSKKAGVNIVLYPNESGALKVIFIKRPSNNPHDKHGGQISFPGGQMEATDQNLIETALRETEEEIGVARAKMKYLGALSPIYVYVSDFLVQPIVSYVDHVPELQIQETEVESIISERLGYFMLDEAIAIKDYKVRNIIMKDMPYYKLQNHILWGATAMITSEFVEVVRGLS